MIAFDEACSPIEAALTGSARRAIVADAAAAKDLRQALLRLRDRMRSHVWKTDSGRIELEPVVKQYDRQTRLDGFHVLHDWDGLADRVNEDSIPVDVLQYLVEKRGADRPDSAVLAILLDYYFLHLLALLSLRLWDDGDADEHLDRLNRLLLELQGPNGSGQRFAGNAETLILIATSHFEIVEQGYARLLERVQTLNRPHRTNVALGHAASMGSHLRFGFEATYRRDTVRMREDNVADYPWLCFALWTVMQEYARMHDAGIRGDARETIVEGLLNGLSPDARAFVGQPPAALSSCERDRAAFRDLFNGHRPDLLEEFERHRPSDQSYSPLSFFFNFSHNILKGTVVDALLRGRAWTLTFNDLLTGIPRGGALDASRRTLATTLMTYARANPDPIGDRMVPAIVYDPRTGHEAFTVTMRKIRE